MSMTDFTLKSAASWTHDLPHQRSAWDWLESKLNKETLQEFKLRYRNQYRIESISVQYRVPEQAISIIQHFEGLVLDPYICPAGIPTIGWGTTVYPNGKKVTLKDPKITKEQAREFLIDEIEKTVSILVKEVPYWNSMSNNQRAALISFAYNLGPHFMSAETGFNTIQRQLKSKQWDQLPNTLLLYRNPGTSAEAGLLRRRQDEAELWQDKGRFAKQD